MKPTILTLLSLLFTANAFAQTTWNGGADANWGNPANWSAGVPDADDDVRIPVVANNPVVGAGTAAAARSVLVQADALLTISAGGKLTISSFASYTTPSTFTSALANLGTIDNLGELVIGSTGSSGDHGIYNPGRFNNMIGAKVEINNSVEAGIFNSKGRLENRGEISIGSLASSGNHGLWNDGQIYIYSTGKVVIDRTSIRGIMNNSNTDAAIRGAMQNDGEITIGATANVGISGFENLGGFVNAGTLKIDRAATNGFRLEWTGSFRNDGTTIIGANVPGTYSISNAAVVGNEDCAEMRLFAPLNMASDIANDGFFEVNTSGTHTYIAPAQFMNNGVLVFPQGNTFQGILNKEIVNTPGSVSSCGSLNRPFGAGPIDFTITGVFTDQTATTSAGVYDGATNTFTPDASLSEETHNLFVRIADGANCSWTVPWQLTLTECCAPPVLAAPDVAQTSCSQATGAITVHATGNGALEYSVDNGQSWSENPVFSSLPGGSYILKARLKASPACEGAYPANPVVINPQYPVTALDTWTGCVSTNWHDGANWMDGTVPTGGDNVTIPNVTNAPVIMSSAIMKSLHIQPDALLTINAGVIIGVQGKAAYTSPFNFEAAVNNEGKIDNSGSFDVGSDSAGDFGIINHKTFNNNADARISISKSTNTAFYNASGTFSNAGMLTIGERDPVGLHGIWNDAVINNNADGQILISNSTLRALVNNADESKSIHATFNNAADLYIGVSAGVGTIGIRNMANFNNNAGGDIVIDQTTDIGLYNSAGTFTNSASLVIGWSGSTGIHGLVNEGIFEHTGAGSLWIGRATGSSIYQASGTFNNASDIVIGEGIAGGTTGIESRAAFNNHVGGDIRIDNTSEVGLYHIAGTFTNDGDITIGNGNAVGQYGLRNTGEFKNNAGSNLLIDRSTVTGLWQTNADAPAPAATFVNAGNLTIGSSATVGPDGLENQATFTNTGAGHIRIDRSTNIALKTPFGAFTNEAQITLGGAESVGSYGMVNRSTFQNSGAGHIRIDRSTDTGLYHSSGTFTNDARLTIGASQSPGINGIFNEAPFTNEDNGDIRIDGSTNAALRNFQNTFTNAGSITTGGLNYTGDFGIRNQATFLNNAGGTISLDWSHDGIRSEGVFENTGTVQFGAPGKVTLLLTRQGGSFNNNTGGVVKGTGSINPLSLTSNGGTLSPGYSPGMLTFNASHDFTNSILDMELNGLGAAGTDYDQIVVTGQATLGGTLAVKVNYTPAIGDQFTILSATLVSGTFSSVTGLAIGWKVVYEANAVKLRYDDPMPVTLVSFNARPENSIVRLEWRTTSETDNAGFYIERSTDAFNWNDIGFVDGNATTAVVKDYTFRDEKPAPGLSYYRLRQTDFDGTTERSRAVAVRFGDPQCSVTVWADPARLVHIQSSEPINQATVYDLSGRVLVVSKESTMNLSRAASGIVLVRVTTAGGTVVKKVVLY
ncbi:Por secretion system C-terminal sorting domain-containing protein [Dyadobacter sp. SG02]|uniref:T9SS type A sorting domain-containing protein n=1 Tax=Dyadobacter sp. SG02 TaxID=1855291 RepID=UPI0008BBCDC7|nr:T9SS type A sorting domain-containing protein [Dyadobacter sp. SG02]SEI58079.1 Por secretion system C-terminal sorting domain-containing protein [Dyadobacter sp. SG02]